MRFRQYFTELACVRTCVRRSCETWRKKKEEDSEPTDIDNFIQPEDSISLPTSRDNRSQSSTSQSMTPSPIGLWPKRKKNLTPTDEVIQLAGEHLRGIRPDDEFESYGKYVAHKLRSLKGKQAIPWPCHTQSESPWSSRSPPDRRLVSAPRAEPASEKIDVKSPPHMQSPSSQHHQQRSGSWSTVSLRQEDVSLHHIAAKPSDRQ
ncbi:hypothetical protein ACJJTC_019404 [Scirpophaga incertulas]